VMDLRPLADGRLVVAGGDPAWGVLDPQLRRTAVFAGPPVLDHRSPDESGRPSPDGYKAFRQAPDGRWLEFRAVSRTAQGPTARLVRFDLAQRRLLLPGAAAPGGLAPRSTGLPIEGWFDTTSPTLAGKPLPLEQYETSRSLAISADGSAFALGSEWAVRVFEADGRERWRTSTPGIAWLVNLSADGRFVVAALGDGTIRWYRSSDGSQALALFVHPDGQRWMQWTPEGFYDASPGGAELFGYHLNNGRDQPGTFISSAQLQQKFFRPDLIARRRTGAPEDEAAIAAAVAEVGDVRTTLRPDRLPPSLRLLSQRTLPDGDIEITYELNDQGGGLGPVELRLDGAVLEGRADPPVAGINRRRLRPPAGKSRLQLLAYSRSGVASSPVGLDLTGSTGAEPATLHLLAVGITNYRDGSLRRGVRFAAGDAVAFREALTAAGRASTTRVAEPVLLRDEEASGERIRQELTAMAQRVKPADLFVLYLAGHGVSTDQGGGIGPVELKLDGAVLAGRNDPPVGGISRRRLRPPAGKSRLQLLAYSRGGVASLPVGLDLTGTASGEPATLHLLAVGITNYRDGALRQGVKFAAGDAKAIAASLSAPGRAATARVAEPVLLTEEQATGNRIRQELEGMARRVQPADVFVLYLAGHGVSNDQGEYVFLPQDLLYQNSTSLRSGLDGPELRRLLAQIKSTKTVVVLDTCSSGAFRLAGRSIGEKGAIDRLSRLSGRVVLAAAGDQRMALESPDNQRGIYTGALLRALSGQADTNRDGLVGIGEVADFVDGEVQRITLSLFGYLQTPMREMSGQTVPLTRRGTAAP
ncbi:MAG: caspase family protein, partial [Cyanobium sp.]